MRLSLQETVLCVGSNMTDLIINPNARVDLIKIGHEEHNCLVIDDLLSNPDDLVLDAVKEKWGFPDGTYYPGINANLPTQYIKLIGQVLRPSFSRAFNVSINRQLGVSGFFALTTLGLKDFGPWQKIPHFDKPFNDHYALVHYLAKNQTGGTGFFRHLPTGYESISHKRRAEYLQMTEEWLKDNQHKLVDFAGPNTPNYEMYFSIPFKFNRAIIYPANLLHCALYDGTNQNDDPITGRLTANSFWVPYD